MTLSFDRLTGGFWSLLGLFKGGKKPSRLDLTAMSERDIADLNLPPEMQGRLLARRDVDRIRRGF
jgi:hypothetical protein